MTDGRILDTMHASMLDLSTLVLLLTLSSTVLGISTLVVSAHTGHHPGLATWGWALIVNSLSYLAFGLRMMGWPGISIFASNVLTPLSISLFILALLQFHRVVPTTWMKTLLWSPVALGMAMGSLLQSQHELRNAINVIMHTGLMLMMAWAVWRPPEGVPRLAGHRLIIAGALGLTVVFLWRAAMMTNNSEWPEPLFVPPQVQLVTYLMVFVSLLTNTMGFVMMQMERAIHRQHDLATHDPLTGACNRRELLEVMGRVIGQSERNRQPLSVLMIDIDHFKRVNDQHGHLNGDAVLREVATRLQGRLRKYDLLARFGGEEFVVLLPQTTEDQAVTVAESLRETVARTPVSLPSQAVTLPITVSIGVHSRIPANHPDEADQMISACDQGVYQAKSLGRNRVEVHR